MLNTINTSGWVDTSDGFENSIKIEEKMKNEFENQINEWQRKAYYWEKRFFDYKKEKNEKIMIKRVIQNTKKNATTVIFEDGGVVVIKRSAADPEADIYSIVAYAVAEKIYKSNSAFKRMVDETVVIPKKKKGDE